ncbi:hypothetical protein [Rossellomorea yichunensis]|jgi:hypothetical protein|nr:hypothetical protein [Rossellomorea sp. YC4-1]MDT9026799.1 hypothetical protein [Rossellomorea sp. YC4-1]
MKRRFLTVFTASILLLSVYGFATGSNEIAGGQIQQTELPGNPH